MSDPVLLVERCDGAATLTLNRPAARNALSTALRAALVSAFRELADDDAINVVILTGAGVAFTAGLDLKELSEVGLSGGGTGEDPVEVDVIRAMHEFSKPIIGAINGPAVTGGFEVTLACDFRSAVQPLSNQIPQYLPSAFLLQGHRAASPSTRSTVGLSQI